MIQLLENIECVTLFLAAKFHQTREALLFAAQSLLFDSEEKDSEEPKSEPKSEE